MVSAFPGKEILIGEYGSLTGGIATFGISTRNGSELAFEEINKKGGILGRQIELIHLDPQGDNARYQEFARRLLSRDKVEIEILHHPRRGLLGIGARRAKRSRISVRSKKLWPPDTL